MPQSLLPLSFLSLIFLARTDRQVAICTSEELNGFGAVACFGVNCAPNGSGRIVTAEERDVMRGDNKWKGSVACLGGLSGPVGVLPLKFCSSGYTLCHFGMSVSFQTCLCVCVLFQKSGRRRVLPFARRQKQNRKEENLLIIHRASFQ